MALRSSDGRAWTLPVEAAIASPAVRFLVAKGSVHELTIVKSIVDVVTDEVGAARVHVVRIRVGRGACVSPHALRFCFDVCTIATPLHGATLEIVETDGDDLRVDEVDVE